MTTTAETVAAALERMTLEERCSKEAHEIFCRLDVLGYLSVPDDIAEQIARAIIPLVLEEAAKVVEDRARFSDETRCCGFGAGNPPECCGEPDYMIADRDAVYAIRALKGGQDAGR